MGPTAVKRFSEKGMFVDYGPEPSVGHRILCTRSPTEAAPRCRAGVGTVEEAEFVDRPRQSDRLDPRRMHAPAPRAR